MAGLDALDLFATDALLSDEEVQCATRSARFVDERVLPVIQRPLRGAYLPARA